MVLAAANVVFVRGLAVMREPADLLNHIRSKMYDPTFRKYV